MGVRSAESGTCGDISNHKVGFGIQSVQSCRSGLAKRSGQKGKLALLGHQSKYLKNECPLGPGDLLPALGVERQRVEESFCRSAGGERRRAPCSAFSSEVS